MPMSGDHHNQDEDGELVPIEGIQVVHHTGLLFHVLVVVRPRLVKLPDT